jgi:hypothetical protein
MPTSSGRLCTSSSGTVAINPTKERDVADDEDLSKGDQVEWNTSQGTTSGEVVERITDDITIKDHEVKASEDNPKYVVESDKTGARAAHKPESLDEQRGS